MVTDEEAYLRKANESLAGAQSELAARRFNNSANRSYYACFQAAVAALIRVGIGPGSDGQWSHEAVQAQFASRLINQRKLFSADLADTLSRAMSLRQNADYRVHQVSEIQAQRLVRRVAEFVRAIETWTTSGSKR
jgi:uncharacterized protein (UPF0332 family)